MNLRSSLSLSIGLVSCLIFNQAAFAAESAAGTPHVAILWPDSAANPVNPRLVYRCAEATCADLKNAVQVGFVTAVPVQQQYGTGGTVAKMPSPITFIEPVDGPVGYIVFVSDSAALTPKSTWKSCILSLDAQGNVAAPSTTCLGAVKTANATPSVATIAFGAPPFASTVATPPAGYNAYNALPDRNITFKNATNVDICLNLESKFNTDGCKGAGDHLVAKQGSYVLKLSSAANGGGSMSHAAFVTGYRSGGKWHYSGQNPQAGVYATAMEWSLFPTAPVGSVNPPANTTDHSIGMSDVDISVVNGYNFGVALSSASGAVCSAATIKGGTVQPALYRYYTGAISAFPEHKAGFEAICPAKPAFGGTGVTEVVRDKDGTFRGCMSPCQYATQIQKAAGISQDQLNAICCAAGTKYDDSAVCTGAEIPWGKGKKTKFNFIKHSQLPYVVNVKGDSRNVYSWQFDDDTGNFSCQPGAS